MTYAPPISAQIAQQASGDAVWGVVLWVIALIVGVLVLGMVLMKLRRAVIESEQPRTKGLLLDDLRRLRDEGLLSAEEYRRAVEAMAERMGASESVKAPGD